MRRAVFSGINATAHSHCQMLVKTIITHKNILRRLATEGFGEAISDSEIH